MPQHPIESAPEDSPKSAVNRRKFLEFAGLAAGTAALLPLTGQQAAAATGGKPGTPVAASAGWSLPDFATTPPFSFTYGGVPSHELLPRWRRSRSSRNVAGGRQSTVTWTDPVTGLKVALESVQYSRTNAVSWLVNFTNTSTIGTRLIENVLALDVSLKPRSLGEWTVHTSSGSDAKAQDFSPFDVRLPADSFRLFSTANGRPSDGVYRAAAGNPWAYLTGSGAPGYINSDQHSTTAAGATASLTFEGTAITWIGVRNVDCGKADVLIDGEQVAVVDQYATSWLKQVELFTKTDLAAGTHTIVVRSRSDKNPAGIGVNVNVDAFKIGTGDDAEVVNDNDPRITYGMDSSQVSTFIRNGWPYFNFDWGGQGMIAAIGWPGQWALQSERIGTGTLRVKAGMTQLDSVADGSRIEAAELTALWLEPREQIRTPRIVVLPWQGQDWHAGQNDWRQWFVAHQLPHTDGAVVQPLAPTQSNDYFPEQWDTSADQITWLNAYGENHATPATGGSLDHWWIDAGWAAVPEGASHSWNWPGSWFPDPDRYPDGLKPALDRAHELGMRTIVWFEPERVRQGTWLHVNHPEWLLSMPGNSDIFLLDFGKPAVRQWATKTIGDMIVHDGIDVYREDFNVGPLPYWRENDAYGRRGMLQIRYVEGHLAFWQGLQQRKKGLVIDTCASGGRRMDVETLGLAVNLLRSDYVLNAIGNQTHIHGASSWVPLHGGAVRVTGSPDDVYNVRSNYGPSLHNALDVNQQNTPWDTLKETTAEWKKLSTHLYGDYFPLTDGGPASDVWIAWQFGERDASAGFVQVFRRPDSPDSSTTIKFRGLQQNRQYKVTDRDSGASQEIPGSDLMNAGLQVSVDAAPAARILEYQRV
ncbi:alpha-galactosidase [Nakamurella lactea]|uniref:alpha-galactosidase n=1 Tax=Nakamurella lactea TaxID=459515 RepID=UPI000428AB10|nr:alpha-galactosidase [Nakamurella lactea]